MDTIIMNSENSKNSARLKLLVTFLDKINLIKSDKYCCFTKP